MGTVSGVGYTGNLASGASSTLGSVWYGKKEFLQVLCAELSNQNPLEPMKNSEFIGQLAQLAQIDFMDQMKKVQLASSVLGKQVKLSINSGGAAVQGVVERVVLQNGQPYLVVGGKTYPVDTLTEVSFQEVDVK